MTAQPSPPCQWTALGRLTSCPSISVYVLLASEEVEEGRRMARNSSTEVVSQADSVRDGDRQERSFLAGWGIGEWIRTCDMMMRAKSKKVGKVVVDGY